MFDNILRIIWAILTISFVGLIIYFRKPLKSILYALGDMNLLKAGPLEFKRRTEKVNQLIMAPEKHVGSSDTVQSVQCPQTQSLEVKISNLLIFHLLCFYCLVKSFRCRRGFSIPILLLKMYSGMTTKDNEFYDTVNYTCAVFDVLGTYFFGMRIREHITIPRIQQMPSKMCDSIEKELDRRINEPPIDPQYQVKLLDWKRSIDDYFSASEKSEQSKC